MDCRGWTTEETSLLISLWADESVPRKLGDTYRNRPIYEAISKKMLEGGYSRGWQQCQRKIEHLKIGFQKAKDSNSKSGRDRVSCSFYDELDRVLGDRPSFCPREGDVLDSAELDYTEEPLCNSTALVTPPDYTEMQENDDQADEAATPASTQTLPEAQPSSSKRQANFCTRSRPRKKTKIDAVLEILEKALSTNDEELLERLHRERLAHEKEMQREMMHFLASTFAPAHRPPASFTPSYPAPPPWYHPMPQPPSQPGPSHQQPPQRAHHTDSEDSSLSFVAL